MVGGIIMLDLIDTMEKLKKVALDVGKMQKEHLGRKDLEIHTKSTGIDLVTEIDKKSEEYIVRFIQQTFPQHAILAEESGRSELDSDYLWVVDPLDGTTNYAQGLPVFAVSIALQYRGETLLGIVYLAALHQIFTAIKGQGAYLNGEKLQVSAKVNLADCVLATGFPYDIVDNPLNNLNYFSEFSLKARAIRRMGAAAYDVACVAAGKFDGYWEMRLSPWDVAAAMLMVEEAGGKVIHFRKDRGISIIAANPVLADKIQAEIKRIDARREF